MLVLIKKKPDNRIKPHQSYIPKKECMNDVY